MCSADLLRRLSRDYPAARCLPVNLDLKACIRPFLSKRHFPVAQLISILKLLGSLLINQLWVHIMISS